MQKTELRVGLIGTGIMGTDHARTMENSVSGASIVAVADIDQQRAGEVAAQLRNARALASADELIASTDVDAVLIVSSDATHAGYVAGCLAARKPVLCEKPLAPTVAECAEILRLEQEIGHRFVQVGFNRRFDPGFVELHDKVAAGAIGDAVTAHCVHRNVSVPPTWQTETIVNNSAPHEIDVMPWIFGRPVVRVHWASPVTPAEGVLRDPQIVTLELEGGALVTIELFMTCAYGYEIRCEVVGRRGTLELALGNRVSMRSNLNVSHDFPADWRGRFGESYRRELQAWVDAIHRWHHRSDDAAHVDPVVGADAWDGYRVTVVAQAILDSMHQGAPVAVPTEPLPELYRRSR